MEDPYTILGVRRDASPVDIEAAFRAKAFKAHPDRGGTAESFDRLKQARDLLKDPVRRLTYDSTGQDEQIQPDHIETAAMDRCMCVIQMEMARLGGRDPMTVDWVAVVKNQCVKDLMAFHNEKAQLTAMAIRDDEIGDRFQRPNGKINLMARMFHHQAKVARAEIGRIEAKERITQQVAEFISEYKFDLKILMQLGMSNAFQPMQGRGGGLFGGGYT